MHHHTITVAGLSLLTTLSCGTGAGHDAPARSGALDPALVETASAVPGWATPSLLANLETLTPTLYTEDWTHLVKVTYGVDDDGYLFYARAFDPALRAEVTDPKWYWGQDAKQPKYGVITHGTRRIPYFEIRPGELVARVTHAEIAGEVTPGLSPRPLFRGAMTIWGADGEDTPYVSDRLAIHAVSHQSRGR